ncbi:otubain [Trypanosoma theileri]|uniref:Ubiquitin thioesterase n=1 Tax=Trypanosoma theileri TaxID=67003 RepID=A0A1X0NSN1_9TRYP|nr:otubain [Trypanosoma theileri]ORC87704.1 otubain [Trypanosoma theileri]
MSLSQQREEQLAIIQSEIETAPLISDPVEVLSETCHLVEEYANNSQIFPKVLSLFHRDTPYTGIRYARRDGNCFYRCVVFALLEQLLGNPQMAQNFMQHITQLRTCLINDYGDFVEDFCDAAVGVVRKILDGSCANSNQLHTLATSGDSEYMLYFYRYAVSNYMRTHRDDFLPFVMGLNYDSVEAFCRAEVDAVASESDNMQVVAFAKCFHVSIIVEYLNGGEGDQTTEHFFSGFDDNNTGNNNSSDAVPGTVITLLYRPGHYDLLYK